MRFPLFIILYLLALAVLGWRLARSGRALWQRVLIGTVAAMLAPALFVVPTARQPHGGFDDLLVAVGACLLVVGLGALALGASFERNRARKRRP
jgi:peptidoglycan/LPS O-acetylase OafA/YrhL